MKVEKVKLTVTMPKDLIDEVDMLTELMGYNKREKFIESAIRRLVDK
ncbi:ribbon-helix-helix protein, CopG family [Candidatus Bathyarchaeota archaeon]|nr:ribbon-helix-helix protein, CopG family [Candidatus Bathyarchaeota archaeon]